MEIKSSRSKLQSVKFSLGYQCLVTVDGKGLGGGLALFWNNDSLLSIHNYFHRFISYWIQDSHLSKKWMLICFYGYPKTEKRFMGYELLRYLSHVHNGSWLVMGDLMRFCIIMRNVVGLKD